MALTDYSSISYTVNNGIGYVYSERSKKGSHVPICSYSDCRCIDDVVYKFLNHDKRYLCMGQETRKDINQCMHEHSNSNVDTLIDELNKKYNKR